MELIDFLKNLPKDETASFREIFTDISQESSPVLIKQLDDRLRKLKSRIRHSQEREAGLKDKLAKVTIILEGCKKAGVTGEGLRILQNWRDELLSMIDKIEYKDLESKYTEIYQIRETIRKRNPIMQAIAEVLNAPK